MLPYRDVSLSPEARAADLLPRLNDHQLLAQLGGWIMPFATPPGTLAADGTATLKPEVQTALAAGIGAISYVNMGLHPAEGVAWVNALQRQVLASTPFAIPAFFCEECAWGHVSYEATAMPHPNALAATWDTGLVERVYAAVAREARARGGTLAHTPIADLARDPRWGRVGETFGEDALLAGSLAAAAVRGLQGGPGGTRPGSMAATVKHFAGFAQSAGGRQLAPVELGRNQFLNDILPSYRLAIEAGAEAVMPSYSCVDGVPSHADPWLLTEVLRRSWGFTGVITCDYGGIDKLVSQHHVAANDADAAELSLRAGMDMDLPENRSFPHLLARLSAPAIRAAVTTAVRRVLILKFRLGLFEQPFADAEATATVVGCPEHHALATEAAVRAAVLLQNRDNVLPLTPATGRIALIGPLARHKFLGDDRSGRVTIAEGLQAASPHTEFVFAPGCRMTTKDDVDVTYLSETAGGQGLTTLQAMDRDPALARLFADALAREVPVESEQPIIEAAAEAARACGTAVVCLGESPHLIGEIYAPSQRGDRDDIRLVGNQLPLLRAVRATGARVILVLVSGRALALDGVADLCDAILWLGDPGEARGTAVGRIVFGLAEPEGRLAVTLPLTSGGLPVHHSQPRGAWLRDYALRDRRSAWPFGFGLGYTTFSVGAPQVTGVGSAWTVRVRVANTGQRAGATVVQAYLRDEVASIVRPERALCAWARVVLEPGASTEIELVIPPRSLAVIRPDGSEVVEPGVFSVGVGQDSQELTWTSFTVARACAGGAGTGR